MRWFAYRENEESRKQLESSKFCGPTVRKLLEQFATFPTLQCLYTVGSDELNFVLLGNSMAGQFTVLKYYYANETLVKRRFDDCALQFFIDKFAVQPTCMAEIQVLTNAGFKMTNKYGTLQTIYKPKKG